MVFEEREIVIDDLAVGMYVCRLDRPWTGTPFPLQGFIVEDRTQLGMLRELCARVWIDIERGHANVRPLLVRIAARTPPPAAGPGNDMVLQRVTYLDTRTLTEESAAARDALDVASRLAVAIVDAVHAGLPLSNEAVRAATAPIVASVLRNADALFWVNALRRQDDYSYSHAINCSALAAAYGRHLGMPGDLLVDLASGALLLDIGKTRVPDELVRRPGPLNALEMARMRQHVELGLQILGEAGQTNEVIVSMVRGHHERVDGKGYPGRRWEGDIPLYARMAAIIDSFDAMTSHRPYAAPKPRHEALQELYRGRDTLYQAELVEQFISCLGVYPTGSLAELTTGEVVVVVTQNPSRRLRPKVLLLTDPDKQLRAAFSTVDLMDFPIQGHGSVGIRKPLQPGEFGIDPAELYL
jgi:putative nucleotidyltransferase with HDIG domain